MAQRSQIRNLGISQPKKARPTSSKKYKHVREIDKVIKHARKEDKAIKHDRNLIKQYRARN